MKSLSFISWILILVLTACQTGSVDKNKEITDADIARTVEATHIADIQVSGMTCEMGCGGDIRKALRGTGGVSKVDFDFVEDRTMNIAKVSYDAETINEVELKKVIQSLNKGQFTVGEIQTSQLSRAESSSETSSSKESGSSVQLKNSMLSLSDLAGIVASWFM